MAEPSDLLPIAAGPVSVAVWEFGRWLILGRLQKAEQKVEKVEAEAEQEVEDKLDTVLALIARIEKEMALMARDMSTHSGTVAEVKGRIEGMSANYGTRLTQLERELIELRSEFKNRRRTK